MMLGQLWWLAFLVLSSLVASSVVSAAECPTDPPAIASLYQDLPIDNELSIRPDLSNVTNLVYLSANCCAYYEVNVSTYIACNDFSHLIDQLLDEAQNFTIDTQLAIYLGIEEKPIEITVQVAYLFTLIQEMHVYGFGGVSVISGINDNIFQFNDFHKVTINDVSFINGGISFHNCFAIQLNNVLIRNSTSNPGCSVFWSDPLNSTITSVSYTFSNCYFVENQAETGAGLHLRITENHFPVAVEIINCLFDSNSAKRGGAMAVYTENLPVIVGCRNLVPVILFFGCNFINNIASSDGGAIYLDGNNGALYGLGAESCSFINNTATHTGGAVKISLRNFGVTCQTTVYTEFKECNWTNNSAELSAAMAVENTQPFRSIVNVTDSTFIQNHARQFSYSGFTYCIVYCDGMNATLWNTTILNNNGSGFCSKRSKLSILGTVEINRNLGFSGGGIFLDADAWLSLDRGSNLRIIANRAVYGAGLYQTSTITAGNICFLAKQPNSTTYFKSNTAYDSGDDIYLNAPEKICEAELASVSIPNTKVASSVYSIELNQNETSIILGQYIWISASVVDYFGNASSTIVSVFLLPKDGSLFNQIPYNLGGFSSFIVNNGSNTPELYIYGPNNSTAKGAYSLVISTSQQLAQIDKTVSLTIIGCSLGFTYVPSTGTCICASEDLQCDFNTGSACARKGYWHGKLEEDVEATAPCVSGNCLNTNNCSVCPSKGLTTYCLLPKEEFNECNGKWTGPLCSECETGYSYSFLARQCVKSSTCTGAAALVPTVLLLAYLLIVIGIIFTILKLGYHIQSGYFYCIVYYFSIVKLLLPKNYIQGPLEFIISIFQSILQLDSYFLGYIPVCVSPDMTILQQRVLLYLNPLIVSFAILGIIAISKRCSKYIRFKDNSALKAISLLILLSFTTLTETSFNILIPIKYDSIDSPYVKIQPSTKYLDSSQHLPWWIIAVLVLCLFVIPFTVLLLLAPLLIRCINLTKIKPFLDEFQGCYKDQYRWMAGYYFLCRIVLFLSIATSVTASVEFEYIAMVLSLVILIIHMAFQPYRNNVLNMVDSLLLADLVFIALLYTKSSEIAIEEVDGGSILRQFATYILVIAPIIYTMLVAVIAVLNNLPSRFKQQASTKYNKGKDRLSVFVQSHFEGNSNNQGTASGGTTETTLIEPTEVGIQRGDTFNGLREPLLDTLDDGSI